MPLYFDTTTEKEPSTPDHHAHEANDLATYAADAQSSREALERQIIQETDHPTHSKLLKVSTQGVVIYGALALAFLLILFWEWSVSKEIYEVLISSAMPWVPFLGCVAIAFYASVCIGESTSRFSVLSTEESAEEGDGPSAEAVIGRMYDTPAKRKSKTNWLFHPLTGLILALLFLGGIYLISLHRVELLSAAGEMAEDDVQVWLPVILYAIEIVLGIPTFFFAIWVCTWLRTRSQRKKLSKARMNVHVLRQSAVRAYTTYVREFEIFNGVMRRNNKVEAFLVLPNSDLRKVLEDSGYNLTAGSDDGPAPNDPADQRPVVGTTPRVDPPTPQVAAPHINASHNGHEQNRREEDLLALLDEHINSQNRGL